ncbi:MAG: hypothetical protein AAF478_07060 [Pseudomonadota bacterium]
MKRLIKRYTLWIVYVAFLAIAIGFGSSEGLFATNSEYAFGKVVLLFTYFCFLAYSLFATSKENFFRSVRTVMELKWGFQICADLYISVFLSLGLIYLVEGSLMATFLWAIPILFFANLAILPYLILNYSAIIAYFIS